jgi:hypothetical protein
MQIMPILTNPYTSANYNRNRPETLADEAKSPDDSAKGCETCDNRRYRDVSNDGSVSMQSPTKIAPEDSASAVAAHEQEHIRNDRLSAESEGREVVAQYVRLMNAICGECGKTYVAGGSATTISASKFDAGKYDNPVGDSLDVAA